MQIRAVDEMKRAMLLAVCVTTLSHVASANAQGVMPSENDIFALYCLGVLGTAVTSFDEFYPVACPTGQERDCVRSLAVAAKRRNELARVRRYVTARGYSSSDLTENIVEQIAFTIKSGAGDAQRCLKETADDLTAHRRSTPAVCTQIQRCGDLSRLPI
jgi:hypothetical protein